MYPETERHYDYNKLQQAYQFAHIHLAAEAEGRCAENSYQLQSTELHCSNTSYMAEELYKHQVMHAGLQWTKKESTHLYN